MPLEANAVALRTKSSRYERQAKEAYYTYKRLVTDEILKKTKEKSQWTVKAISVIDQTSTKGFQ